MWQARRTVLPILLLLSVSSILGQFPNFAGFNFLNQQMIQQNLARQRACNTSGAGGAVGSLTADSGSGTNIQNNNVNTTGEGTSANTLSAQSGTGTKLVLNGAAQSNAGGLCADQVAAQNQGASQTAYQGQSGQGGNTQVAADVPAAPSSGVVLETKAPGQGYVGAPAPSGSPVYTVNAPAPAPVSAPKPVPKPVPVVVPAPTPVAAPAPAVGYDSGSPSAGGVYTVGDATQGGAEEQPQSVPVQPARKPVLIKRICMRCEPNLRYTPIHACNALPREPNFPQRVCMRAPDVGAPDFAHAGAHVGAQSGGGSVNRVIPAPASAPAQVVSQTNGLSQAQLQELKQKQRLCQSTGQGGATGQLTADEGSGTNINNNKVNSGEYGTDVSSLSAQSGSGTKLSLSGAAQSQASGACTEQVQQWIQWAQQVAVQHGQIQSSGAVAPVYDAPAEAAPAPAYGIQMASPAAPASSGCGCAITIKSGDLCYKIVQTYNVQGGLEGLQALNPSMNCNLLNIGQRVCVSRGPCAAPGY